MEVFADVDAYVSSVAAYEHDHLLEIEGNTPLEPCSADQAADDSFETYPNRTAEGDRVVGVREFPGARPGGALPGRLPDFR